MGGPRGAGGGRLRGGRGWAGKRREWEGEPRALTVGALTALPEPRPAFLRAPGAERFTDLGRSGARGRARGRRVRACGAGMGASAARGAQFPFGVGHGAAHL